MKHEQPGRGDSQKFYSRRLLTAIAKRWDARAKTWDPSLQDPECHLNEDNAYNRFVHLVQRLIASRRRFCSSHGVIDAGCGTGLVLGAVISAFSWGVGVDISPAMIRIARAKRPGNAKFLVGDCFELPTLCPKGGAVLSRGVLLSHYGGTQGCAILRAARDALVPQGFAVFDFLNEGGRRKYPHSPENKSWFTRGEVREMATEAGFSAITILGEPMRRVLLLVGKN